MSNQCRNWSLLILFGCAPHRCPFPTCWLHHRGRLGQVHTQVFGNPPRFEVSYCATYTGCFMCLYMYIYTEIDINIHMILGAIARDIPKHSRLFQHSQLQTLKGLPGLRLPRFCSERGELRRCTQRRRAQEFLGAGGEAKVLGKMAIWGFQ